MVQERSARTEVRHRDARQLKDEGSKTSEDRTNEADLSGWCATGSWCWSPGAGCSSSGGGSGTAKLINECFLDRTSGRLTPMRWSSQLEPRW